MQEAVVVGGGIAGCAVALALRRRGALVTVVERARVGAEATGASAGILAAQQEARLSTAGFRLGLVSRAFWPRFADEVGTLARAPLALHWEGALVVQFSEAERAAAAEWVARQRELGLAAELLEPEEARALEPAVATEIASAVWHPGEGWLDAQALAALLRSALLAAGTRVLEGVVVAGLVRAGGRVSGVRLADGRALEADTVVLAAGAWSPQVAGLPGPPLPVRPIRGQILRYAPAPVPLRRVVADAPGRYVVPRPGGALLAGSTMEDVGFDRSITDAGAREVARAAARLVPALGPARFAEHWAGLRPVTADGEPILGPDPEVEGLFYATGFGRHGILVAPFAGELVAELAVGGTPAFDWEPFSVRRFRGH